jgi:hypothetical protein
MPQVNFHIEGQALGLAAHRNSFPNKNEKARTKNETDERNVAQWALVCKSHKHFCSPF